MLLAVRRRAACFVKNEYCREPGTVSSLYRESDWETQEKRRQILQCSTKCSTSTSIRLLGKTVMHRAEGVRRADVLSASVVELKSLARIRVCAIFD